MALDLKTFGHTDQDRSRIGCIKSAGDARERERGGGISLSIATLLTRLNQDAARTDNVEEELNKELKMVSFSQDKQKKEEESNSR